MMGRAFLCFICTSLCTLGYQAASAAPTGTLPPADCYSKGPLDTSQSVLPPNVQRGMPANAHMVHYPPALMTNHIQGNVRFSYVVDADGKVTDVTVLQSSGNPDLDAAAVKSVQAWRYHPTLCDGKPIAAKTTSQIVFQVRDQGPHELRFVAKPAEFPAGAQAHGESGVTWLMVDIGSDATLRHVAILERSGYADLDAAAASVVRDRLKQNPSQTGQQPSGRLPVIVVWPKPGQAN